jgi:hypothetical protein
MGHVKKKVRLCVNSSSVVVCSPCGKVGVNETLVFAVAPTVDASLKLKVTAVAKQIAVY